MQLADGAAAPAAAGDLDACIGADPKGGTAGEAFAGADMSAEVVVASAEDAVAPAQVALVVTALPASSAGCCAGACEQAYYA